MEQTGEKQAGPRGLEAAVAHAALLSDPVKAARAAGLRYVSDTGPGIRRKRSGKHFKYTGPDGAPIQDPEEIKRFNSLAIPPAYRDVWICPIPNGHLQATGRDSKGRKQYRYHPRWRSVRDETKYGRMLAFGIALPKIRQRVNQDLAKPGLSHEKVLATVVRLLETTLIRVGNDEYAKENRHFGLTTLQHKHVEIDHSTVHFHFRGKSGKIHQIDLKDRRLAGIIKKCRELPGYELFKYADDCGEFHTIDSADVNEYLREIAGDDFTAKDFRTWAGTVLAALALQSFESVDEETQAKRNVVRAIEDVARQLGNTPSICRKCYVHPEILNAYLDGTLRERLTQQIDRELSEELHGLEPEEAAVLALLRTRLANAASPPVELKKSGKTRGARKLAK